MDEKKRIAIKTVISNLIKGIDYRIVTQTEINSTFLQYCMDFFKKVVELKMDGGKITPEWYKENLVQGENFKPQDRAVYAGINQKTINNMFNTSKKEVVISASEDNFDALINSIQLLIEQEPDLSLNLRITFKEVSVELSLNEALIFITSLAVKRAAITGGAYSSIGKGVEGPLMLTLCKLFNVSEDYFSLELENGGQASYGEFIREIDFFLKNEDNVYKCEVKLMGKGNPEVADAVIARESRVFVADRLSQTNKNQLDALGVFYTELRNDKDIAEFNADEGFLRFHQTLDNLNIPYEMPELDNIDELLNDIFDEILSN